MLDDHKYSIGRLVVYRHSVPKLPRQSYGLEGSEKTIGEVLSVEIEPFPKPNWVYTIRNTRNSEVARVSEDDIRFAAGAGARGTKSRRQAERKAEDVALAEMIARALTNPDRAGILRSTLRDFLYREELEENASRNGTNLPIYVGDYIRVRGDLRKEIEPLNNHYARIMAVDPSDVAGIEVPNAKPGHPTMYRTLKKYRIVTSEKTEAEIYDAEIKLFYTANSRKTILNWRAVTLLAEVFGDTPPYNLDHEYLNDHIFTRDELKSKKRSELAQTLATMLYVKGKMGWRKYQRRNVLLAGTPKNHIIDSILEVSRFDSRKNRMMTIEEIAQRTKDAYKLRRLLKS